MKRKILGIGKTALGITLPSKWYQKNNLKKGDIVNLEIKNNDLNIQLDLIEQSILSTEVDISRMNPRIITWTLSSLHKKGYDEIKIHYDSLKELEVVKERMRDLFTGFAIIDQGNHFTTIRSISTDDPSEFENVLRRVFRVTINMAERALELIKKGSFKTLRSIIDLEETNNQLTNFCQRLINKEIWNRYSSFYYVILWNLEKTCDDYKYICFDLSENKISINQSVLDLFSRIIVYLKGYYDLFYDFNFEKLIKLDSLKESLQEDSKKIFTEKISKIDMVLFTHLMKNISKIADFSASMIAIRHEVSK